MANSRHGHADEGKAELDLTQDPKGLEILRKDLKRKLWNLGISIMVGIQMD